MGEFLVLPSCRRPASASNSKTGASMPFLDSRYPTHSKPLDRTVVESSTSTRQSQGGLCDLVLSWICAAIFVGTGPFPLPPLALSALLPTSHKDEHPSHTHTHPQTHPNPPQVSMRAERVLYSFPPLITKQSSSPHAHGDTLKAEVCLC